MKIKSTICCRFGQLLQFLFNWVSDGNSYIFYRIIITRAATIKTTNKKRNRMQTHFFHILGFLGPCTLFPFGLDVSGTPCLAYNTCRCVVWEFDTEFGQLKISQTVRLTWYSGLWSIDEYLQSNAKTINSFRICERLMNASQQQKNCFSVEQMLHLGISRQFL